jgi:hypothetical protein
VIVQGRYDIVQSGRKLGQERFRLHGHVISSEVDFATPADTPPLSRQTRIALDTTRSPVDVEITVTRAGETTRGRFRVDRDPQAVRVLVRPQVGASIERFVPWSEDGEIDYPSPLFAFVTAVRLRLRPGERRDVPALVIAPQTLVPEVRRRRYRRLPDVELATPAGQLVAQDYIAESIDGPSCETRFQANLLGLPLRMRIQSADGEGEYVLVE